MKHSFFGQKTDFWEFVTVGKLWNYFNWTKGFSAVGGWKMVCLFVMITKNWGFFFAEVYSKVQQTWKNNSLFPGKNVILSTVALREEKSYISKHVVSNFQKVVSKSKNFSNFAFFWYIFFVLSIFTAQCNPWVEYFQVMYKMGSGVLSNIAMTAIGRFISIQCNSNDEPAWI